MPIQERKAMGTAAKTQLIKGFREWVTLDEAKAFLRLSEKSIQRLKRAGHLRVRDERREGKMTRLYSGEDLQTIKAKAIPASAIAPDPSKGIAAVAKNFLANGLDAAQAPIELTIPSATVTTLRDLVAEWSVEKRREHDGEWLTLPESASFTRLPKTYLLRAIVEKRLRAVKAGGWRIRRSALREFQG
jgi:excisionase family DNA binding protein